MVAPERKCWACIRKVAIGLTLLLVPFAGFAHIQQAHDVDYATSRYAGTPCDAITRLQMHIDTGQVTLNYDANLGYLPAVLKALHIPVASQMLVFSKTSVQKELISPHNPRALYFNDESYVGYVPTSPALEVATMDPKLGTVYYVLLQKQKEKPRFFRNIVQCMECHGARTEDHIPIHLLRSVYPDSDGVPCEGAPEYPVTEATDLRERWGGWYVTGRHGSQRHMGNTMAQKQGDTIMIDREKGANVIDLRPYVDTSPYLSPHSDIVALMIMAHQTHIQNLITKASYEMARTLAAGQRQSAKALSPPGNDRDTDLSESVKAACESLVRALLFVGEPRLTDPIVGTSGFAAEFAAAGPRDRRSRSLRELDLKHRLFRYPCSYIIYSGAFNALPGPEKEYVYRRLWEVLRGQDQRPEFASLSPLDRKAIKEILQETKPDFAEIALRKPHALHRN